MRRSLTARPGFSRSVLWVLGVSLLAAMPSHATSLAVGPVLNTTGSTDNNAETTIAVNPLNPNNLFVDDTYTTIGRYSTNGGTTWQDSNLSALPVSDGDVSAAWDAFGNLFLCQFGGPSFRVAVGLSTNGGSSFSFIFNSTVINADQPTITVGPSSTPGQGSVWISYTDSNGRLLVQGASVTGLGQVSTFGSAKVASTNGDFGDIAVGPNGQVMVVYQDPNTDEGPDTLYVNVDPDGLGSAGFGPAIAATTTQVGGHAIIPAQPIRTIDAEPGLAWDCSKGQHRGRVYLMYTDRSSTNSYDTDIFVRYSDNSGTNWSSPVRVNDDALGNGKSQFLPRIALDQTTGYIAVSFYDCRNATDNDTTEFWASVSTNGGVSFMPNVKVSGGVSSAQGPDISSTYFDYGDYTGLAFNGGVFYPCWADNSNSTGDNPAGSLSWFDMYVAPVSVVTPVAPVIVSSALAGPNFIFSFPTLSGLTYTVQYANSLAHPSWANLQTLAGDGAVKVVTNAISLSPQRFYRVSAQ